MTKEIYQVKNTFIPFQEQVELTDLTVEDVKNVTNIYKLIEPHIDKITDQFYKKILSIPHLREIIESNSAVEKLRETLKRHIESMFTKNLNDEYLVDRNQIALIHYLVKLEPKWYIAAFQYLAYIIQTIIIEEANNKEDALLYNSIVSKYISLEMQIVLEAYENKVLSNLEIDELLNQLESEQSEE